MNAQQFMGNNVLKVNSELWDLKDPEFQKGFFAYETVKSLRRDLIPQLGTLNELIRKLNTEFSQAVTEDDYRTVAQLLDQIQDTAFSSHHEITKDGHKQEKGLLEYMKTLQGASHYQWYLKHANGYCQKHDEAYQKLWDEYQCESCFEEVMTKQGWCGACRKMTDLVEGSNYCRAHYEAYQDEVNS